MSELYSFKFEESRATQAFRSFHSMLVIWLQTLHLECQLLRKKNHRSAIAIWNPYLKEIEPLRCEISNAPVTSFYLTDDEVQIISPQEMEKLSIST